MKDSGFNAFYLLLILLLPLSSLMARRIPFGTVAKMALAWAAIFGMLIVVVGNWGRVAPAFRSVGDALGITDQSVSGGTVRIRIADDGHFWAQVSINRVARRMLIDSGATITALSLGTAEAAGLDLDESIVPAVLDTANGPVRARSATVKLLDVGSIHATDLPVVVSPAFGDTDVIGMNFLSRLKSWRVEGSTLVLEPRGGHGS